MDYKKIILLVLAVAALVVAGKFGIDIKKTLKDANEVLVEVQPLLDDDKADVE